MPTTTRIDFAGGELQPEALIALLAEYPFDAFEEGAGPQESSAEPLVRAYAKTSRLDAGVRAGLARLCARLNLAMRVAELPDVNYNARWESDYPPVELAGWLRIRAPFHEPGAGFVHEVIIVPEMSFGTGHHATTSLMAEYLRDYPPAGKAVFDLGTGTGVLAILARLTGAATVDATDIDERCVDSTLANAARNGVDLDEVCVGTEESLPAGPYDLVLANINRAVLLAAMGEMAARLAPRGELWVSGVLEGDLEAIDGAAFDGGLTRMELRRRAGWLALRYGGTRT